MKTMKKFLSMAALAMVGAMTVGCTNEDNVIDQAQTATKNNVVTQTVTVGLGEQAATRALAIDYGEKTLTKTFKAGDQIAVIYQNTSDKLVKVETTALTDDDITAEGKSAKFTVTMTDPKENGTLKYIYPAAMAGATDVDYTKLNSQDGTLASLASNLDLATFEGTLTGTELPASASLTNKLAILALTIKDNATTPNDITSTITSMTISDGTNSYSITGKDDDGHIYAAIQPTTAFSCIATDGTNNYAKSLTSKDYQADNIYNLGLKMDAATTVSLAGATTDQTIQNGQMISGTLANKVKISIADGAIITLSGVSINADGSWKDGSSAGITCLGDATIILEGENTVQGLKGRYPGIYVPQNKTLTIMGSGKLTARSGVDSDNSGMGDGIGSGTSGAGIPNCGNIVIKGGTIIASGGPGESGWGAGIGTANGNCGNITISGGNVTATGGYGSPGIGGNCGDIIISGGTVTATAGNGDQGAAGIGSKGGKSCGDITISGGTVIAKGSTDSYNDAPGAGIGGGFGNVACGVITITSGVTSVTATKGGGVGAESIGKGKYGTAITVIIEDESKVTKN